MAALAFCLKWRKSSKIRFGCTIAFTFDAVLLKRDALNFLYKFFIAGYSTAVRIASLRNKKAKQWLLGRKHLFRELEMSLNPSDAVIWMHCASAGEFEQGKPVLESLKQTYPGYKVAVSFFSPSGFSVGKKYKGADIICYLPVDTEQNAKRFISLVNPKLAIFVKYDFWYYHLKELHNRKIPLLLISSVFRKDQVFFKPYGIFYRKLLHFFSYIFVQDKASQTLLKNIGINQCGVSGDTRFDRVSKIAESVKENVSAGTELVKHYINDSKAIVAGSTWPDDEKMFSELFRTVKDLKLIIAPHEITEPHLASIEKMFDRSFRYSRIEDTFRAASVPDRDKPMMENDLKTTLLQKKYLSSNVLIIDNIGMLSQLYQYATITYIGGGFNKSGIHNTLEAAVWGKPVLFGPNYKKFKEAKGLVAVKGGFSVSRAKDLKSFVETLLSNPSFLQQTGEAAKSYVQENKGATDIIIKYIQENRLLTN